MSKTHVIVGYLPLVYESDFASKGVADMTAGRDEMLKVIELAMKKAEQTPVPIACIWGIEEDGSIGPIFLVEKGEEIADHLRWYSEMKPQDWFNLHIHKEQKRYHVALVPKPEKMQERYRKRLLITRNRVLEPDTKFQFIFKPLHFVSNNPPSVVIPDTKTMPVGIMPVEWEPVERFNKTGKFEKKPISLGVFNVNPHDFSSYFEGKTKDV